MTPNDYRRKAERLMGDVGSDRAISDVDYVEICEDIAQMFQGAADAKAQEMEGE